MWFYYQKRPKMPSNEKIKAIQNLQPPKNKASAQKIFGLLNYQRTFIPNFASKATAITKAYRGEFEWTKKAQNSLEI
jgi:hypothetical protein